MVAAPARIDQHSHGFSIHIKQCFSTKPEFWRKLVDCGAHMIRSVAEFLVSLASNLRRQNCSLHKNLDFSEHQ